MCNACCARVPGTCIKRACNKVNGVPAVANPRLSGMLRSWGFTGYRTTDGDGINGMNEPHRQNYTATVEDSIRLALTDGETDIDDGNVLAGALTCHLRFAVL